MEDYWSIAGIALVAIGILGALVEPMLFRRMAENSPPMRERLRALIAAAIGGNVFLAVFGALLLVFGENWFGAAR